MFDLLAQDPSSKARRGRLTTPRGAIETPEFMPVGTQGSVKAVTHRDLLGMGTQIILGNTYHLFIRPGLDVIRHFGGLHKFISWEKPMLTDSGGFQVFSLAKLRKITEEGVSFQSHVDGAACFIGPETAMEIQTALGSDIAMVFDECPHAGCGYDYAATSLALTLRWAKRCRAWWDANHNPGAQVFGIVQGSTHADLRRESAEALVQIGFDGYAVGGVSVGESEEEMFRAVENSEPFLPADKPRYTMGLGTPPQMVEMVARGVDLFDCVLPTRIARNGTAYTELGTLCLKNAASRMDTGPIEEGCECYACRTFSQGYLRHLLKAEELLGLMMVSLHNSHFYLNLMRRVRESIERGTFAEFRKNFVANYVPNNPSA